MYSHLTEDGPNLEAEFLSLEEMFSEYTNCMARDAICHGAEADVADILLQRTCI